MATMTKKAIEIRGRMIEEWVKKYGVEVVEGWSRDDVKRTTINAMAQIVADRK